MAKQGIPQCHSGATRSYLRVLTPLTGKFNRTSVFSQRRFQYSGVRINECFAKCEHLFIRWFHIHWSRTLQE